MKEIKTCLTCGKTINFDDKRRKTCGGVCSGKYMAVSTNEYKKEWRRKKILIKKCTNIFLHNFPDICPETKCIWCGKSVLEIHQIFLREWV